MHIYGTQICMEMFYLLIAEISKHMKMRSTRDVALDWGDALEYHRIEHLSLVTQFLEKKYSAKTMALWMTEALDFFHVYGLLCIYNHAFEKLSNREYE